LNIEQIFYAITTTITVFLTVLTLQRLLSGWWRTYYLLGLVLVLGLTAVVPPIASWASNGNWKLSSAQRLYWLQALTAQTAMALLVLQLIYRVGRETPARATLIRMLTLGSVLVVGVSVAVHFDKRPNTFMASVARDLTFLSAILNMVLWRFLMQVRKKDFLLLAVSAGLGIQCTGDAIGHSFRILARQVGAANEIYEFGNILMSLSAVMTVAIWHTAFSRSKYKADQKTGGPNPEESNEVVTASHTHPAG
jgi:hypothetical protein